MALIAVLFDNLYPLNWTVSVIIPLIIILLAIINRIVITRIHQMTTYPIRKLTNQINELPNRHIDHLPQIRSWMEQEAPETALNAFDRMEADHEQLYQGRWVPDPKTCFPLPVWISSFNRSILTFRPAAQLIGIGVITSLIALVLQQTTPLADPTQQWLFILLPVGVSLAVSLPSMAASHRARMTLNETLEAFYHALGRRLPVFNHQTGVATLVDTYLNYDHQMQERLNEFTEVTRRLADSEMADGVRRSVEQILTESVGPSLHQATAALGDLAVDLTNRQSEGMKDLAGQFAEAVSRQIATHLAPVNRDIAQMSSLMADVKNYIEVAMRAMDSTRTQTESVQSSLSQSLEQLSQAHAILQKDFETVSGYMANMSDATQLLTETYQKADASNRESLERLTGSFESGAKQLTTLANQAAQSVDQAQSLVENHTQLTDNQIAALKQQSSLFSDHLQQTVRNMLDQMHGETESVATHAESISQQLASLNQILDQTIHRFSDSSTAYVHETLNQFDESLADITMRLTQTAQEIQDAVDALPASIQRSVNFGS